MSTASGDEYLVAESAARLVTAEISAPAAIDDGDPAGQWPFLIVGLVGLVGLVLIASGSLLRGLSGLTVAMALAGMLRLVLPARTAGWLSSRSRMLDVAGFTVLACALGAVTLLLMR